MKWIVLFAGSVPALAQAPADFEKSVRTAMAPALAQQRASVRKQAGSVRHQPDSPAQSSFFTLPPAPAAAAAPADCDPLPDDQLDTLIDAAAEMHDVDPDLVRAVVHKESAGRPCAVSTSGAEGLMQLMPDTADELDVADPFDPQQNVEAGTRLLKLLLNRYGNDPSLALGAYNAGPARVDQAGGVPAIPETLEYVADILSKLTSPGKSALHAPKE